MEDPVPTSEPTGIDAPTSLAARSRTDSDAPAVPDNIAHLVPSSSREADRKNIIREMLETERKYVGDLEVMQVRRLTVCFT